jgi:hypothetical protein
MPKNTKFSQHCFLPIAIITILLIPYMQATYWHDDAFNQFVPAHIARTHSSYIAFANNIFNGWIHSSGRILLGFYTGYAMFFIKTPFLYHLTITSLLLINVYIFLLILQKLNASQEFIILFNLILFGLFSITPFFNPITTFAGLYQMLGILLCLSIIFLLKWTETFSLRWLILSVFVAFSSLFFYELNLIYFPIAFITILSYKKETPISKPLFILLSALGFFILLITFLRMRLEQIAYTGNQFGDIQLFGITYLKQLSATFPDIYYLFNGTALSVLWLEYKSSYFLWFLIATIPITLVLNFNSATKETLKQKITYFFSCLVLFIVPMFMAFSLKYQHELSWGIGYLPIYYQTFALALLLTGFILQLYQIRWMQFFIISITTFNISLNWMQNMHNVAQLNDLYYEPVTSLSKQLKQGLMNDVKNGDIIKINNSPPWISGALIYQYTGKRIIASNDNAPGINYTARKNASHYELNNIGKINGKTFYTCRAKVDT